MVDLILESISILLSNSYNLSAGGLAIPCAVTGFTTRVASVYTVFVILAYHRAAFLYKDCILFIPRNTIRF